MSKSWTCFGAAFFFGVCLYSCSDAKPNFECAAIAEAEGEVIARRALVTFIDQVKRGGYGGTIADGGKEIAAERIRAIRSENLIYTGVSAGEVEDGSIYEFLVSNVDDLRFGVHVFENCNTEVRWRID